MSEKSKIDRFERRHRIERKFHNKWARTIKLEQINYLGAFEAETAIENRYALSQIDGLKNRKILDLGCGMGDASIYFALKGADVYAVDISSGMIGLVKKLAKNKNLSHRIKAVVMVAEKLKFPENKFDFVFGNGVLHHVEIGAAINEIYRVLNPGGTAVFIEPLKHNPVINIYRSFAKKVRTPTETPISYKSLENLIPGKFRKAFHKEFHLFTLLIFVWYFLFERINPNKVRYWKKIIDDSRKVEKAFTLLNGFDQMIFRVLPFLRRYAWNSVIVLRK